MIEQDDPVVEEDEPDSEHVPLPPLNDAEGSSVNWQPCDEQARERIGDGEVSDDLELSCATVSSVIDPPGMPDRGTIRMSLLKVGQGDVPLLVVNDIGGQPGTVFAAQLADRLPDEILDEFSLIGLDRRYTGQSRPNSCIESDIREQMVGFDPAAPDITPLLDTVGRAGQQCTIALGNEQGAIDSWRSAGDLEHIREALGVSHLHAIGRGNGSEVLDYYAQRYPDSVGRFVFDGMPDPTSDEVTRLEGVAEGAEDALAEFDEWCSRQDCGLDQGPEEAVDELVDELRTSPLRTPDDVEMGPAVALHAIWSGLAERHRWDELAAGIADARDGDPDSLAAFVEPMLQHTASGPPTLDTEWATRCNDAETRLHPDQIGEVGDQWREQYPTFGGLAAQQLAWCSAWPADQENPGDMGTDQVPPILVASTATDPITPEEGTERGAMQLPTSVSIAWQGAGHGALGRSDCITDLARDFLLDGEVPQGGTPCPA